MTGRLDPDDPGAADAIAEILGLQPLPAEGGRFRRAFADQRSSAIYYLLTRGDSSADMFTLGDRVTLTAAFPIAADRIVELTR